MQVTFTQLTRDTAGIFVLEGLYVLWILFALGPGGLKFPLDYKLLYTEPGVCKTLEQFLSH